MAQNKVDHGNQVKVTYFQKIMNAFENFGFAFLMLMNFRLNIQAGSHMTKVKQKSAAELTQAAPTLQTLSVVCIQARRN